MSVWFAVPSKRPLEECQPVVDTWRDMGYRVALMRDPGDALPNSVGLMIQQPYPGYSKAVNRLVAEILKRDPKAEWIVTGGDDTYPDPNKRAMDIAFECNVYFGMKDDSHPTLGVMQPTGDRWGEDSKKRQEMFPDGAALIDRICGSPWMGRELCLRLNGGRGPMWPEYFHMFNDEEMFEVTRKLGVLWQRRDLNHRHDHWMKKGPAPAFLARANSKENWDAMRQIFMTRKAAGFPGHEFA